MTIATSPAAFVPPKTARVGGTGRRTLLVLSTLAALALTAGLNATAPTTDVAPDLVRLLRFMALLKGVFALAALAACFWRLARPATLWREAVYVAGPGLMAAGAICLWHVQSPGIAATVLHLGLFALLAAALTDEALIPALRRSAKR